MRHRLKEIEVVEHPLSRIDARVKLLAVLGMLLMVLTCRGFSFPLLVGGMSLVLSLFMRIRLRLLALRFAQPCLIALMIVLLKLFATGQIPLFSWSLLGVTLVGYSEGLREGLLIASRIAGAVSLVSLLAFSTTFTELMSAFAWLRVPQGLIEVAMFAWRYLFMFFEDAMVIYSAQKNRLGYAGYRQGLRSFGTLTGAMVIKSFDSSQTITTAMVQRGYDGTMPPMAQHPILLKDAALATSFVAVMAVAWSLL